MSRRALAPGSEPRRTFESPVPKFKTFQNSNPRRHNDLGCEHMNSKMGRLRQKSSGPFCEDLGNSRLKCDSVRAERATFAFWSASTKSAQKSVELKRDVDWTLSFAHATFAQIGVQKPHRQQLPQRVQPGPSARIPFSKMTALARCRLGSSQLASSRFVGSQRRTKTNSEGIQTLLGGRS
jgi:hypothetical protein